MIQVDPIPLARGPFRVGRGRTNGAFLVAEPPAPAPAGAPVAAGPEAASLVSLQEAALPDSTAARDRAAHRRCGGLLATLRQMQLLSLGGGDVSGLLDGLRTLVGEAIDAADPSLRTVLAVAITRARVELARHGER